MSQDKHHRNDVYGKVDDRSEEDAGVVPAIPAATVVLLRDRDDGPEVLMLHKNSKITFGGMWVFPGGMIDPGDYPANSDLQAAARAAAAREATEEANVYLSADDFVWFAHWTPPPSPRKRFATFFFAALDLAVFLAGLMDSVSCQGLRWAQDRSTCARAASSPR